MHTLRVRVRVRVRVRLELLLHGAPGKVNSDQFIPALGEGVSRLPLPGKVCFNDVAGVLCACG